MARAIVVDQDSCISCGLCVDNLPEVFRFDDNGKAVSFDSSGAPEEMIQTEAVDVCPVACIHWE
ncbi:ferredoxin [Geobacter pelophilus]|uniref:Ferredoxin n=1 Tax=Geoanaerobacter pelophilus TaxID=60036 RepID=A0AAW4L9Q3_9BACT|nr:ferredoxin [Geoanaerobacter pelophilus]MBT0666585.1 ferredoxin [Geoanaerobacter pelophilus]